MSNLQSARNSATNQNRRPVLSVPVALGNSELDSPCPLFRTLGLVHLQPADGEELGLRISRICWPWDANLPGSDSSLCTDTSTLLKGLCSFTVVEPVSYPYPGPSQSIQPTFPTATADQAPYPPPTPEPVTLARIDAVLGVNITGDTLILTRQAGAVQTFHRMRD
jgi:hypothetical protein